MWSARLPALAEYASGFGAFEFAGPMKGIMPPAKHIGIILEMEIEQSRTGKRRKYL